MRIFLIYLLLIFGNSVFAQTSNVSTFCPGLACPCGNDSPLGGCINSTGRGGVLTVENYGNAYIAVGTNLPSKSAVVLIRRVGQYQSPRPFRDGNLCVGGSAKFFAEQFTSVSGTCQFPDILNELGHVPLGSTILFQILYRDPNGSPCKKNANVTNGCGVILH